MKNTKEIKNLNFHQQINGEKLTAAAIVLLLQFNDKVIYDSVCCETNEELQNRIKEIKTNNIVGVSYIAITDRIKFVEYKRITNK